MGNSFTNRTDLGKIWTTHFWFGWNFFYGYTTLYDSSLSSDTGSKKILITWWKNDCKNF